MAEIHWKSHILPLLPPPLREVVSAWDCRGADDMEEIRLRAGRPLIIQAGGGELAVPGPQAGTYRVSGEDIHGVLLLMTEHSLYARDEELRRGYLALPGGHRAGFAGRTVLEDGNVRLLRDISGICIRIAREVRGAGEKLLPLIFSGREQCIYHTLLVSPPQAGKTTLLRDLARLIGDGDEAAGRPGFKVGIVDERSEIAGCFAGCPQLDVGLRTDVLDGCPKAEGMMMLVRSMSPQVVVTDELGRAEDIRAVEEVIGSGAAILATAHGRTVQELLKRPGLRYLLGQGMFERIVFLSRRRGPGTVEKVMRGEELVKLQKDGGWADAV